MTRKTLWRIDEAVIRNEFGVGHMHESPSKSVVRNIMPSIVKDYYSTLKYTKRIPTKKTACKNSKVRLSLPINVKDL